MKKILIPALIVTVFLQLYIFQYLEEVPRGANRNSVEKRVGLISDAKDQNLMTENDPLCLLRMGSELIFYWIP